MTDPQTSGEQANARNGVESVAAYAPRYRIDAETVTEAWGRFRGAGIETTAVPAADEDVLTMSYEAGLLALETGDVPPECIDRLFVATTTPPDEEEGLAPRLVSFFGFDSSVETRQFAGGTRAGIDALSTALDADAGTTLVVAGDAPRGAPDDPIEHASGAGAAAVVVQPGGSGQVIDRAEQVEAAPGTRFRPPGSDETTGLGVTGYERSAYIRALTGAAERLAVDLTDIDAVCLQSPNGKLPYRAARALGVESEAIAAGTTIHELGDTGAASVLIGFAAALEDGCSELTLIGYGPGGGATAMAVDGVGVPVETALDGDERLSYAEYLRIRGDITSGEPDGGGAYVSVPSWKRTLPQRHRLVAGRCRSCDALAFPPSGACTDCGTLDEYERVELPRTGTVEAATTIRQGGAPPEFVEQQARSGSFVSAIVAFDGPAGAETVSTPTQVLSSSGAGGDGVAIGDRVTATIRRIYTQEGVTRYGFKVRLTGDRDV